MVQSKNHNANILVADDDPDDRLLVKSALEDTGFGGNLQFVSDGEELMNFLHCRKCRSGEDAAPLPDLILLDLDLPKRDGREALREIKADPDLHGIIIVALTGSVLHLDAKICRQLGANYLMPKPESYLRWVQMMGKVVSLLTDSQNKACYIEKGGLSS